MARKPYSQTERCLRILLLLATRSEGLTIEELRREFHVSRRNMYRDLDQIQLAGFPVFHVKESHGAKRWRIHRRAFIPVAKLAPLPLSPSPGLRPASPRTGRGSQNPLPLRGEGKGEGGSALAGPGVLSFGEARLCP